MNNTSETNTGLDQPQPDTFEIGLVMAGAISGGAYTAGAIDFMIQALQQYETIREKFAQEHPGKSLHKVQIRLCSGASAGGQTGTMLLSAMMDENYKPLAGYDPKTVTREAIHNNVFYRSWVDKEEGIDISYLLDPIDINETDPIKSLLNCQRIEKIADQALCQPRVLQPYSYIPDRYDQFLTVFNMSGVPYKISFEGSNSNYGMINHADMMHFAVDRDAQATDTPNEIVLKQDTGSNLDDDWELFRLSTLASGAFPIALEPRPIYRNGLAYDKWKWWVPHPDPDSNDKTKGCRFYLEEIEPKWPDKTPPAPYQFIGIDGGVANNEPLEIARRTLADDGMPTPRDKDKAHRAILMVDPFPAKNFKNAFSEDSQSNFLKLGLKMFSNLKIQARFKPQELALASNPTIFNRFLIAPTRRGAPIGEELACASLNAFGGLFSEKFRQHDFQLGRKNCQFFLRQHFTLGIKNPLVKDHIEWFRANGCVVKNKEEEMVQIIPLIDLPDKKITDKINLIPFDSIKMTEAELAGLVGKIKARILKVMVKSNLINDPIQHLIESIKTKLFRKLISKLYKGISKPIYNMIAEKFSLKIQTHIRKDFKSRDLM